MRAAVHHREITSFNKQYEYVVRDQHITNIVKKTTLINHQYCS